jgi:vitamin B12 transporter
MESVIYPLGKVGRCNFLYLFKRLCLLGGLLLSCLIVSAQNADSLSKDSLEIAHRLKQVSIFGKESNDRNKSATPLQIIKGEALQRLNSFSVADALRYFSGVQLKDYGGIGGLKTVNVRSMGSNHTTVFYDGVQVGNAQNGQIDLGRFSLDNIEEVALYSGQKSDIFQPAKSFSSASTIYIQSRRPQFEENKNFNLRANIKTGSFGLINPSLLWEQKLNEKLTASVSGEWVNANGAYKYNYSNGVYDTTAVRNNTDLDAYRLEAGLYGSLADSSRWSVKAYGYTSERGLPGAIVSNKFDYSQRQWDRNAFLQAHFQTNEIRRYSMMLNAKYANDYLRYFDPELPITAVFRDNRFRQQEIYLSTANRYKLFPILDLSLSVDYQRNTLDANLYRFPYPTRQTVLAVIASELKLKRFSFQASLLGTFVFDSVKEYASAGNKKEYTPTFMATFQPFNNPEILFRAFYKNIFRLPTFNDLYYTFSGNAQLRPEFTDQYNLGFTYAHAFKSTVLESISIQTDAYYIEVRDKIVAVPSLNLYRWTMYNIGKVGIKGVEVNMQSVWRLAQDVKFNAVVNYTFQQARDITSETVYKYNIPYIPLHSGSLSAGADWRKFEFNYSFIYTGERYNQLSTDQNEVYNYMEPWYTHDVSFGYLTNLFQRKLKVNLEVNNLLNQDREIIVNFPMPRRFYRLKIGYTI